MIVIAIKKDIAMHRWDLYVTNVIIFREVIFNGRSFRSNVKETR